MSRRAERKVAEASAKNACPRPDVWKFSQGHGGRGDLEFGKGDYEAYRAALQQGKTASEAAQAAGGQLAVIHQKVRDYTVKLEALLANPKRRSARQKRSINRSKKRCSKLSAMAQ